MYIVVDISADKRDVQTNKQKQAACFFSKPAAVSPLAPTSSGHFPVISGRDDVTSG
jgi:hypothetical protein